MKVSDRLRTIADTLDTAEAALSRSVPPEGVLRDFEKRVAKRVLSGRLRYIDLLSRNIERAEPIQVKFTGKFDPAHLFRGNEMLACRNGETLPGQRDMVLIAGMDDIVYAVLDCLVLDVEGNPQLAEDGKTAMSKQFWAVVTKFELEA